MSCREAQPGRTGLSAALLVIGLGLGLSGCPAPVPVNEPPPLPSTEKLKDEDCQAGLELYRQRLALPPRAGSVVAGRRLVPPSPEEQERRLTEFVVLCKRDLVGRVRRLILRCWSDSPDAETLEGCNQRF